MCNLLSRVVLTSIPSHVRFLLTGYSFRSHGKAVRAWLHVMSAVVVFLALSVCSRDALADESPDTAESSEETASSEKTELASKLANPSAPVLVINTFWDVAQNGGSAPDAHRASLTTSIQPALPIVTNRGNLIFRPLVPIEFGRPYVAGDGTVDTVVGFGNIALDSLFGKTLDCGLIIMGGLNTVFPTHSKPELRAEWTTGPEVVVGYGSKRTGNSWGAIVTHQWNFPSHERSVGGQYWYAINIVDGWQLNANPVWSYSVPTKTLRFPLGIGFAKVALLGKKKIVPMKFGAQGWLYTPPPDASGPQWAVRVVVAPIVNRPWQKQGPGTLRKARAADH